ncbi:aspartate/glutamate racemase family protein [Xenophilus arseniciresistens]|uniref:Aspartate/glutamate racemase family protein n=1 Tax=Xenophilus arseniciresistens TaxID=1283306 RepID=A0AAE3N9B9_9BURK|nr:aspartate/glutamate racemase family protein [Xenophilus arseniciresistens]MDA7417203.1 aspartate/glutamate racemase family protein [Xenophilus arseniciresistens]
MVVDHRQAGTVAAPHAGALGVVMLDTRFPRPLGDIGHPHSFGCVTQQLRVPGAWPREVVGSPEALRAMAPAFLDAVQTLERQGACAVTTSCGFLVLLQDLLQAAVKVPVRSSSLLQLPALLRQEPQVGVLTISAQALTPAHLLAAGVPAARLDDVRVQGVDPASHFVQAILGNAPALELARAQAEVVAAARALQEREPRLQTLVLECTNLPPYAAALAAATGWRCLSLLDDAVLRAAIINSSSAAAAR